MAATTGRILVIGDSHARFWLGHDSIQRERPCYAGVDVLHLGPRTAFQSGRTVAHADVAAAEGRAREYALLVLCFGEIDCRAHVVAQAMSRGVTLDAVLDDVAAGYATTVDAFREKFALPVVAWGPPPSTPPEKFEFNRAYPTAGTVVERNYAVLGLTARIAGFSEGRGWFALASLAQELIDPDGGTRDDALYDGCHLSQRWAGAARAALMAAAARVGVTGLEPCFARRWAIADAPVEREVSSSLSGSASSKVGRGINWVVGEPRPEGLVFQSARGEDEWFELDLRAGLPVTRVVVEGAEPGLVVEAGVERRGFAPIPLAAFADGRAEHRAEEGGRMARFVRVRRPGEGVVRLTNLHVFGRTFALPEP